MKSYSPLSSSAINSLLQAFLSEETALFFESNKATEEDHASYLFCRPVASLICRSHDDSAVFFQKLEMWLAQGYWLAGWFSYEFSRLLDPCLKGLEWESEKGRDFPLAEIHVFSKPVIHDHALPPQSFLKQVGSFLGTDMEISPKNFSTTLSTPRVGMKQKEYLQAQEKIKQYILDGHTYQVNYTSSLSFDFTGSPAGLYLDLRRNQSVPYAAYLQTRERTILSLSPELFFRVQEGEIIARPMKGTMKRGLTQDDDKNRAEALGHDPKNMSENLMIVDLIRNDLGRVCAKGSVRASSLCDVETYETLHQMTSTIRGRLQRPFDPHRADGRYLAHLFSALFPCGSVTGAPKIRTMEIIRELEKGPRGIYCGAIGFVAPIGDCVFNVPIRTVALENGRGVMGIGSGIVHESDPQQEWEECLLKADFLTKPRPEFQLIETILWRPDSGYWLLDLHLERIERSAAYFLFAFNKRDIVATMDKLAKGFVEKSLSARRIRLLLDHEGIITITDAECDIPLFLEQGSSDSRLDFDIIDRMPKKNVCWSQEPVDKSEAFLYHKTTIRDRYDSNRKKAAEQGFFEVFYTNTKGEVAEGAISNILVRFGDQLVTPPVRCGLLDGVFRRFILETFPGQVSEQVMTKEEVAQADMVYMGNSVRGILPVAICSDIYLCG